MRWLLIFFLVMVGCSSKPTRYKKYDKEEGGYRDNKFDENLSLVKFQANSKTKKNRAELYAKFRAVELCVFEHKKKYAHILAVWDRSKTKEVTRTSSNVYGFPSYYYGSPHWHRYSGIGISAGFNTIQSNSWNETYIYPEIDVVYKCVDSVYEPEVIFREVLAEEMKHLVKDLKGAVQVEKVLDGSPNRPGLEYGDIILKGNGERIQKIYQVLSLIGPEKKEAKLEVLREGKRVTVVLKGKDVSSDVVKSQNDITKAACEKKEIKKRELCKEITVQ